MSAKALPRTSMAAFRSGLALVAVLLSVGGCYDSLGDSPVACRPGKERNCPSGLECRAPAGSTFGRCCKPGDLACGAVDASLDVANTSSPDSSEANPSHDGSGALEAGVDGNTGRIEVGGYDGAVEANPQPGVDADRDVPLIGIDAAGGSGGNTGGSPGTGGNTAVGGVTGGQGGAGGSKTGGSTGATGGVVGTGGAGTGGTTIVGTGGTGTGGSTTGTGGAGTGGVVGTGGTGTGGTTIVGTGGTTVPQSTLITSASGAYWQSGTLTELASGTADLTVNDGTTYQTWEGFGGTFHEKGWSYLSSTALQNEAMNLLFGSNGARFAWGRIPMGANDYAMDRYTDNETAGDTTMANFSISRDVLRIIPYIKAAQAVKSGIRFWASPWTPPTWMKTGGTFDGGNMKSDAATLAAYAQYFVKFVQAYQQQGITIDTVAPQSEPGWAFTYPSCLWDAATYTSFVGGYLGPAFTTAGLSTKIMLGTLSNTDNANDQTIISTVLADAIAKPFISMVGVQWGMADKLSTYKSTLGSLPVWLSEHKCGNYPWNPSGFPTYKLTAPNDQAYGVESWGNIRDAIKAGVTAYNVPHMVLDPVGKGIDTTRDWAQNALLVVNAGALVQTPAYYVFRHLSQFVVPGAIRVATTGSTDALAFKNPDGTIVTVIYNSGSARTMILSVGPTKLQITVPASGWATVKR